MLTLFSESRKVFLGFYAIFSSMQIVKLETTFFERSLDSQSLDLVDEAVHR